MTAAVHGFYLGRRSYWFVFGGGGLMSDLPTIVAGSRRLTSGIPPARIAVRVVLAAVVAGTAVWGAAPSAAAEVTLRYACTVAPFPSQAMTARVEWNVPDSVMVGQTTPLLPVEVTATLSDTVTGVAGLIGAAAVEGGVDVSGVVVAPEGAIGVALPLTVPRTEIPSSGPLTVRATGTTPGLVFRQPGRATITVGSALVLRVDLKDSGGGPAQVSHVDASCTLAPGQSNVLSSFEITAAPAPASEQGGAAPPTTSAGEGSTGTGTDLTTTRDQNESMAAPTGSIAPGPEVPGSASPTATSGPTTVGPVPASAVVAVAGSAVGWWLVTAGILVIAGTVGGVWWLRRRRLRREQEH
jgi:uncharacterized protein DUF6801